MRAKYWHRPLSLGLSVLLLVLLTIVLPPSDPADANTGLVGRWTFENTGADQSGNNNNATLLGAATYGAGKDGTGLVLNGTTNTFAQIASSTSLNTTNNTLTISAWVKSSAANTWNVFASRQEGTASNDQLGCIRFRAT